MAHTCLPFGPSACVDPTMILCGLFPLNLGSALVTLQEPPVFRPQIGPPEALSLLEWAATKICVSLVQPTIDGSPAPIMSDNLVNTFLSNFLGMILENPNMI